MQLAYYHCKRSCICMLWHSLDNIWVSPMNKSCCYVLEGRTFALLFYVHTSFEGVKTVSYATFALISGHVVVVRSRCQQLLTTRGSTKYPCRISVAVVKPKRRGHILLQRDSREEYPAERLSFSCIRKSENRTKMLKAMGCMDLLRLESRKLRCKCVAKKELQTVL